MRIIYSILIGFTALLLASCGSKPSDTGIPTRTAMSSLNVVCTVTQDSLHKYPRLLDSVEFALQSAFKVLPQPEPIFDLIPFSYQDIYNEPLRRALKYYVILVDYSDKEADLTKMIQKDIGAEKINKNLSEKPITMFVGRDKWAQKQSIIYVVANSVDDLADNIASLETKIIKIINDKEWPRVEASTYVVGRGNYIESLVKDSFNCYVKIPKQYKEAVADSNLLWFRRETEKVSMSLVFSSIPYKSAEQLSYEGIKQAQESVGQNISTTVQNTRMVINDTDLPMYVKKVEINGFTGVEAKGIWEIDNDFLGGPFVSYLLTNPNEPSELIFMQGFMYGPNVSKRNYMQQLEYILKTVSPTPIGQTR